MRRTLARLAYLPGYLAINITTAGARFIIVSLLIRNMGAAEFGRWSLFEPGVLVLSQLLLMGVNFGLIKQINQDKRSPAATVLSLFWALQPSLVGAGALVFFAGSRLGLAWPAPLFLALLIYMESLFLLLFSSYRAAGAMAGFAASSIFKVLVLLVASALALNRGWPAVRRAEDVIFWSFWASLAGLGMGLLAARAVHRRVFFAPVEHRGSLWHAYGDAVRYGLPLLATGLLAMVIDFGGRYILNIYVDHSRLANYVVYTKVSSVLELLVIAPFAIWWPTERFRELESPDGGRRFFRMVSAGLLAVLLAAGGSLWLASQLVVAWLAPGVPFSRYVVLLLICSALVRGMAYPLNVGALKQGKTHWNIFGVLAAAAVNTVLCFALIPAHGLLGAACAMLASQCCYTAFLALISQRLHPVPFPYLTMAILAAVSVLLMAVIQRYLAMAPIPLKAALFASLSLILCTPLIAPLFRVKHA